MHNQLIIKIGELFSSRLPKPVGSYIYIPFEQRKLKLDLKPIKMISVHADTDWVTDSFQIDDMTIFENPLHQAPFYLIHGRNYRYGNKFRINTSSCEHHDPLSKSTSTVVKRK